MTSRYVHYSLAGKQRYDEALEAGAKRSKYDPANQEFEVIVPKVLEERFERSMGMRR